MVDYMKKITTTTIEELQDSTVPDGSVSMTVPLLVYILQRVQVQHCYDTNAAIYITDRIANLSQSGNTLTISDADAIFADLPAKPSPILIPFPDGNICITTGNVTYANVHYSNIRNIQGNAVV
jgi:hypothetical protein